MKSKISCFNPTIFKKNMTHFWPIWGSYLAYLMLLVPTQIWRLATDEMFYENYDATSRMYEIMEYAVNALIEPYAIFLFAGAMALAVFSYLYSARNANMMHALPVNRLELYVTNYLSGLLFMIIPQIIVFLISVLVCMANEITCIQYLFYAVICQIGTSFFFYSLAVFVAMFTGQMLAMPAYFLVINYLYIGCVYIINTIIGLINYGITERWNPGISSVLSPLYYLGNNLRVAALYDENISGIRGMEIRGMSLVAGYAVVAVLFAILAYQFYRRRQIETAGDWISVGFVKPVFRWGVAFCGGTLLAVWFTRALKETHHIDPYACCTIFVVLIGFICFFAAEMLIRKNFKVFQKKRILEWAGFTVVAVVFLTLFKVDAFGIERHLPAKDEIAVAFVNMDYPIRVENEDIEVLLEIHRQAIEDKDAYLSIEKNGKGYYYTTFLYYLKDGSTFERRYPLPVTEEYLAEETSPTAQILAWERDKENLARNILGINYESNEYISGYIDLYNEKLEYRNRLIERKELDVLVSAIKKDIEQGNFEQYYLDAVKGQSDDAYYNNISLDYYNNMGYYSNWDYYRNYTSYEETTATHEKATGTASCYITFGTRCVNTIKALEELGIADDTWKLFTRAEYNTMEKISR